MNVIRRNIREDLQFNHMFADRDILEKKILMCVAEIINREPPEKIETLYKLNQNYNIHFPVSELANSINVTERAITKADKTTLNNLKRFDAMLFYKIDTVRILKVKDVEKTFQCRSVVFSSFGISDKGDFLITVNSGALMLFSRYLKYYRHYDIIEAKYLTITSSIEFYKFLKDRLNRGKDFNFYISIDDLKIELGLTEKYKLYGDLKRKVLNPAQKDMQKKSFFWFEYTEKKQGKKVIGLNIKIVQSEDNKKNIYNLERVENYIKTTTEEQFKKDFENFIMRSYYDEDNRNKHLEPLKTKKSLKEFPEKIQLKFINFLEKS